MAQPQWITPAGSLGTIPENVFYQVLLQAADPDGGEVYYDLIAGQLPAGVQVRNNVLVVGVPQAVAILSGVPENVSRDITSKFVIRAYTQQLVNGVFVPDRINDRTFTITITGQDSPEFITPSGTLGAFWDGTKNSIQVVFTDSDPTDQLYVSVISGTLPPGLKLNPITGVISGIILPLTSSEPGTTPPNRNFNFTLKVTDGKDSDIRAFSILVYSRASMSADTTNTTADNIFVTADTVPFFIPVLTNTPGSIGTFSVNNFFAYEFTAVDFNGDAVVYELDPGSSLPPNLVLDPVTGWLYGYLTTQSLAETTYNFGIRVYKQNYPALISDVYYFSIDTISSINTKVTWLTDADLGIIENGATSLLKIEAITQDNQELQYRLENGAFNKLPQGLELLSSGEIAGRATFNTFAVDLGFTTFDKTQSNITGISETTFDSLFTFTVNAYSVTDEIVVVSAYKTFTVKVYRAYNYPYQNLFCLARPPANDRLLINELLDNEEIFVPSYIYRPDDANFGKSTQVKYEHAYGLAPDNLDQYVSSLYENHYWKNLVLGEINTAQALDAAGNVIYEVVYSQIVDNLVNDAGQSVAKIVNLPYAITDPADGSTELTQVYPNSLINMRDQVIDVVGQISTKLPLWMTSNQTNGRVLGFTPSWVICYTQPGRSAQIAYYIQQYFAQQLNFVNFKVDRYVLDRTLSKNWDTATQHWTPQGSLTTFDFYNTAGYVNLGEVECATNLAYVDINFRTQDEINALGGVDGPTWIMIEGQSPPEGTRVVLANGDKIIFVQQENYANYSVTNAWQNYVQRFDNPGSYDQTGTLFDESYTIPGGYTVECTATTGGTDRITCGDTTGMTAGDMIWFTGEVFGDVVAFSNNNQVYYILQVVNSTQFTITDTLDGTTAVNLSTDTGAMTANWGNYRMDIYEVTVNAGSTASDPAYITLSPLQQIAPNSYVTVTQGAYYNTAQLYRPTAPGPGFTLISWLPLITSITVVGDQTTFDQDSMQFIAPVDMYTTSDALDKYLVFPKANILV